MTYPFIQKRNFLTNPNKSWTLTWTLSHLLNIHVFDSPDCNFWGLEVPNLHHIFFGSPSLNKYPLFYLLSSLISNYLPAAAVQHLISSKSELDSNHI